AIQNSIMDKGGRISANSLASGSGRFRWQTGPRILLHHELSARQFRKTPAFRDKLVKSSTFDHAARIEHQDTGGVANRGEPVRDHEGGAPLHHLVERRIDLGL